MDAVFSGDDARDVPANGDCSVPERATAVPPCPFPAAAIVIALASLGDEPVLMCVGLVAVGDRERELRQVASALVNSRSTRTSPWPFSTGSVCFTRHGFVSPIGRSPAVVAMAICWSLCRRFIRRWTASSVAAWTAIPTPKPMAGLLVTTPVETPAAAPAAAPMDEQPLRRTQLADAPAASIKPRPGFIAAHPSAASRVPPTPTSRPDRHGRSTQHRNRFHRMILGGIGIDGEYDLLAVERPGADGPADCHAAFLVRLDGHAMHGDHDATAPTASGPAAPAILSCV